MTRGDQHAAIVAAYRKLSSSPENSDASLDEHVKNLMLGCGLMRMNRLARANNSKAKDGGRKEIERLADLCVELGSYILSMHSDALRPLEKAGCKPHPLIFVDTLRDVVRAAWDALDNGEFPELKPGAPEKRYERSVADHLLADYEWLTGKRATVATRSASNRAYGPFLSFVSEVMPMLGIKRGFESQARAACRRRQRGKEKRSV